MQANAAPFLDNNQMQHATLLESSVISFTGLSSANITHRRFNYILFSIVLTKSEAPRMSWFYGSSLSHQNLHGSVDQPLSKAYLH